MRPSQAKCSSGLLASREVDAHNLVEQVILLTMFTARLLKDVTDILSHKFKHDNNLNVLATYGVTASIFTLPNDEPPALCVFVCECRTD